MLIIKKPELYSFMQLHNKGYNKSVQELKNLSAKGIDILPQSGFLYVLYNSMNDDYKVTSESVTKDYIPICFSDIMEDLLLSRSLFYYKPQGIYVTFDDFEIESNDPVKEKEAFVFWKTPKDWLEWIISSELNQIMWSFKKLSKLENKVSSKSKNDLEMIINCFKEISNHYGLNWNKINSGKDNANYNNWD